MSVNSKRNVQQKCVLLNLTQNWTLQNVNIFIFRIFFLVSSLWKTLTIFWLKSKRPLFHKITHTRNKKSGKNIIGMNLFALCLFRHFTMITVCEYPGVEWTVHAERQQATERHSSVHMENIRFMNHLPFNGNVASMFGILKAARFQLYKESIHLQTQWVFVRSFWMRWHCMKMNCPWNCYWVRALQASRCYSRSEFTS